jgi:hypothetical protein
MSPSTDRDKLQAADKPTLYKQIRVCAENIIRVDDVTEAGGMIGLLCFALAVLTSPFKSKLRLEAENAALRHQLIVLRRKLRGRVRLVNSDRASGAFTYTVQGRFHCSRWES